MPATTGRPPVTPEEYLRAERVAETRSEYLPDEGPRAMTGASRRHNLIVTNLILSLGTQLRRRPCEVYPGDMRVKVERSGAYLYPDAVVVCGTPELEDERLDTLLNPTVVVEVLSPSTADYDRGRKWELYRRLPSLRDYLLVSQHEPAVARYARGEEGVWLFEVAEGTDAAVELASIGVRLPLADLYERVLETRDQG